MSIYNTIQYTIYFIHFPSSDLSYTPYSIKTINDYLNNTKYIKSTKMKQNAYQSTQMGK